MIVPDLGKNGFQAINNLTLKSVKLFRHRVTLLFQFHLHLRQ